MNRDGSLIHPDDERIGSQDFSVPFRKRRLSRGLRRPATLVAVHRSQTSKERSQGQVRNDGRRGIGPRRKTKLGISRALSFRRDSCVNQQRHPSVGAANASLPAWLAQPSPPHLRARRHSSSRRWYQFWKLTSPLTEVVAFDIATSQVDRLVSAKSAKHRGR